MSLAVAARSETREVKPSLPQAAALESAPADAPAAASPVWSAAEPRPLAGSRGVTLGSSPMGALSAEMSRGATMDTTGEGPRAGGFSATTQGSHVSFDPARFSPETTQGGAIIGHEAAHLAQVRLGQETGAPAASTSQLESEAHAAGDALSRGEPASVHLAASASEALHAPGGTMALSDLRKEQIKAMTGGELDQLIADLEKDPSRAEELAFAKQVKEDNKKEKVSLDLSTKTGETNKAVEKKGDLYNRQLQVTQTKTEEIDDATSQDIKQADRKLKANSKEAKGVTTTTTDVADETTTTTTRRTKSPGTSTVSSTSSATSNSGFKDSEESTTVNKVAGTKSKSTSSLEVRDVGEANKEKKLREADEKKKKEAAEAEAKKTGKPVPAAVDATETSAAEDAEKSKSSLRKVADKVQVAQVGVEGKSENEIGKIKYKDSDPNDPDQKDDGLRLGTADVSGSAKATVMASGKTTVEAKTDASVGVAKSKKTYKHSDTAKSVVEGEALTAGVSGSAKGTWDPKKGIEVEGAVGAKVTLLGGSYKVELGPYEYNWAGERVTSQFTFGVSGSLGAEVNGSLAFNVSKGGEAAVVSVGPGSKANAGAKTATPAAATKSGAGGEAKAKVSAFAGAKAGIEAGAKFNWIKRSVPDYAPRIVSWVRDALRPYCGDLIVNNLPQETLLTCARYVARAVFGDGGPTTLLAVKGGVEGTAGIGGEASFNLGMKGGKIKCQTTLQGTVGLGVGGNLNVELDALDGVRFLGLMLFKAGDFMHRLGWDPQRIRAAIASKLNQAWVWIAQEIWNFSTTGYTDYLIPDSAARWACQQLGWTPPG